LQNPYAALKDRLLEIFMPAKLDLMNKFIWGPELGGQRPSQLMDNMLSLLAPGKKDGLLFKASDVRSGSARIRMGARMEGMRIRIRPINKIPGF